MYDDKSAITFENQVVLKVDGKERTNKSFDKETSVEIGAGERGELTIDTVVSGLQDNLWDPTRETDQTFTQKFFASWNIAADESGTLSIDLRDDSHGPPTPGTTYRLESFVPSNVTKSVKVTLIFVGSTAEASVSGGPAIASAGYASGTAPPKTKETFIVDIKVKVPEKPEPDVKVEVEYVDHPLDFEWTIGPFVKGKADKLESGSIDAQVYDLVDKLPTYVKDDLINGTLAEKIQVHGYTSNTDKMGKNYKLSRDRAKAVVDALIRKGVWDTVLANPQPHGEWDTKDPSSGMAPTDDKKLEQESAAWRKVVLKLKGKIRVAMPRVVRDP